MEEQEICRRVWPEWELPLISHGLQYSDACARHVKEEFGTSHVYIIVSKSLTHSSDHLQKLKNAIGEANIAYVRVGMKPHSMYSEVLEIASDLRKLEADCLVTLGGGSIIGGAKGAILAIENRATTMEKLDQLFRDSMAGLQEALVIVEA